MFKTTILSSLLLSSPAIAWNAQYVVDAPVRWHSDTNTTGFKFQISSFPAGSPFRAGVQQAVDLLNQNPSNIRIRINPDTEWVSAGNGQNEIWFTDNSLVNQGAPAICLYHFNPFAFGVWNLMEADVVFNPAETYTGSRTAADTWAFNGPFRPIQTTALHELGHALGMHHENRIYNIMGEDWTHTNMNGTTLLPSRGEDVGVGLIRLYGGHPSVLPDVGVSLYKYLGVDGEYSMHQRTSLTGTGVEAFVGDASDPDPNQLIFRVNAGQVVAPEFTFENNGRDSIPLLATRFVLSNNRAITTLDRQLHEQNVRFTLDRPLRQAFLIRIPADLPSGSRWYLGVIVDSRNTLREQSKRNNATYIPIQIR